jgi:hypothetical protein
VPPEPPEPLRPVFFKHVPARARGEVFLKLPKITNKGKHNKKSKVFFAFEPGTDVMIF